MAFWRRIWGHETESTLAACTALDIGTEFAKALVFEMDEGGLGTVRGVGRKRQGLSHMQSGTVTDINAVVDKGSFFEMGANFGRSIIAGFARLVGDQARQRTLGIQPIEVDRGMANAVVEGGQVAGQLERPGGAHRVADKALGVVEHRVTVLAPNLP